MVEETCLRILKAIGEAILSVIKFVVEIFVEAIMGVRWVILAVLAAMALLWWMHSSHMRSARPYHADPSPDRILR